MKNVTEDWRSLTQDNFVVVTTNVLASNWGGGPDVSGCHYISSYNNNTGIFTYGAVAHINHPNNDQDSEFFLRYLHITIYVNKTIKSLN